MNEKEKQIWEFIRSCEAQGFLPSVREVCAHMGYSSSATGMNYLNRMADKGYLERTGIDGKKFRTAGTLPVRIPIVKTFRHGIPQINEECESLYFIPDRQLNGRTVAFRADEDSKPCGIKKDDLVIIEMQDYAVEGEPVFIEKDEWYRLCIFTPSPLEGAPRFRYSEEDGINIIGKVIAFMRYIR